MAGGGGSGGDGHRPFLPPRRQNLQERSRWLAVLPSVVAPGPAAVGLSDESTSISLGVRLKFVELR